MTEAQKAMLEIAFFDERQSRANIAAEVVFDGFGLTLEFVGGNGKIETWKGERNGQGHFRLRTDNPGKEASLHRFADSTILEGFWRDGSERGFWRLHLPERTPALLRAREPVAPSVAERPNAGAARQRSARLVA